MINVSFYKTNKNSLTQTVGYMYMINLCKNILVFVLFLINK